MPTTPLPNDFVLDLHDLAAVILDCHARTEDRFAKTQLVEVNKGTSLLQALPSHVLAPDWLADTALSKVAYILRNNSQASDRVTIDNFEHPDGVKTPDGAPLARRELEKVFWRCKDFNNGYLLAYTAQSVFERLPPSAKLRARTPSGHEITCAPSEVVVVEVEVHVHEPCLMVVYEPRPDLGPSKVDMEQHLSGVGETIPWIYLMVGTPLSPDLDKDTRVVLDLALPQIGGRGRGGEHFALERGFDYHNRLLHQYASELGDLKVSAKLMLSPVLIRRQGELLTEMVMERLAKVAGGQDNFCRYCGKDDVETRCSKCRQARFCRDCHIPGWKYHKVWCTPAPTQ